MRFIEEFRVSYLTLRDHPFTVSEGEIRNARRLEPDSDTPNIRREITFRSNVNGDVTMALSATGSCGGKGAICAGDGTMLSNRNELTVS